MTVFEKVASLFSRRSNVSEGIIVLSPTEGLRDEAKLVTELFKNGLAEYHVRRPRWRRSRFVQFIRAVPEQFRGRLVLHQHPELVGTHGLGGFHLVVQGTSRVPEEYEGPLSVQCGSYFDVERFGRRCGTVLLGPVFPRNAREGTTRTVEEFETTISYCRKKGFGEKFFAIGGITAKNVNQCKRLGFDGCALVRAIWDAKDPLEAFKEIKNAW
ncbi:MAG: thiamine phosphate synthase [Bacteroidales bacterium]|nr:thiamine phosphate synthase [Bacteroidales bacterium]